MFKFEGVRLMHCLGLPHGAYLVHVTPDEEVVAGVDGELGLRVVVGRLLEGLVRVPGDVHVAPPLARDVQHVHLASRAAEEVLCVEHACEGEAHGGGETLKAALGDENGDDGEGLTPVHVVLRGDDAGDLRHHARLVREPCQPGRPAQPGAQPAQGQVAGHGLHQPRRLQKSRRASSVGKVEEGGRKDRGDVHRQKKRAGPYLRHPQGQRRGHARQRQRADGGVRVQAQRVRDGRVPRRVHRRACKHRGTTSRLAMMAMRAAAARPAR